MQDDILTKLIIGYKSFRKKYAVSESSIMNYLADNGQTPKTMVVTCCDSRVDPAIILQCNPGELFVTRNVASIVPPCEKDKGYHGTSAALEFGIRFLKVEHLILLGHSQCGGVQALFTKSEEYQSDFITNWVSIANKTKNPDETNPDQITKKLLNQSYQNCLTFPWIKDRILDKSLTLHLWFFEIKSGEIFKYSQNDAKYHTL